MKPIRLCKWLLDLSPEIVASLQRDERKLLIVKNNSKFDIPDMRLIAPLPSQIYEVICDYKSDHQLFFITEKGSDFNDAYLFTVKPEEGYLNFTKNIGNFLYCPWFSNHTSSKIFQRLSEGKNSNPLRGYFPQENLFRTK